MWRSALILLLAVPSTWASGPVKCIKKAIPPVIQPGFGWHITVPDSFHVEAYSMHHANGADGPEFAHLTILPGKGFAPHKHLDGWENIYILKGEVDYGYWGPNDPKPITVKLGPGAVTHTPQDHFHKVWNSSPEPISMIVTSNTFTRFMFFNDWPESFNATGHVPDAMPWETQCPPGQEPASGKEEL
ncbi:hypothetical protein HXX76_007721 [Chlamydomonas incerta]|uniref:Cupin type-2 domain-containing protein n=1 Tax=Chlamydomonas incerta TaxID=51695 RepID=A0A835T015_CHLIN|nr:hypothetical protein HXX76_007721 [Chlamydomonas incerta]|eukprot:KAG2434836.1 hypothetical protein HXX76_007721 [Chlamydomonas incerta]